MRAFNFYINMDQCLNMSNFDMFFYKLRNEQKFHLSNVRTDGNLGEDCLRPAFHGIRSFLDRAPFMILDYRLIFGFREPRKTNSDWHDTVLYKELCIYYGLLDEKIFIRSREKADKNVSLIVLYDTDLRQELESAVKYDRLGDVIILAEMMGIDWKETPSDAEIAAKVRGFLGRAENPENAEAECDPVTKRFLGEYLNYHESLRIYDGTGAEESPAEEPAAGMEDAPARTEGPAVTAGDILGRLLTYAEKCVGHYCVFIKEIDSNSVAQSQLALLGIVDYILAGLDVGDMDDNGTLKSQSEENWKNAESSGNIQRRYGGMLARYRLRLQRASRDTGQKILRFSQGDPAPSYREPEKIHVNGGFDERSETRDQKDFDDILDRFEADSIHNEKVRSAWAEAYDTCRDKLSHMEEDLRLMARDLSLQYKAGLEKRDRDSVAERARHQRVDYAKNSVEKELLIAGDLRKQKLGELEKPAMTPSLTFQDQLNLEGELEQSNLEIQFYAKCQSLIRPVSFIALVAVCLAVYAVHHFVLQSQLAGSPFTTGIYCLYVAVIGVLFLLNWRVPYVFYQKRIRTVTARLKEKVHLYIHGYYEKAENFAAYIHLLDETDALTGHIRLLTALMDGADRRAQEYLWHKARLQEHIRRCDHFVDLISTVDDPEPDGTAPDEAEISYDRDVVQNRVYWPQG